MPNFTHPLARDAKVWQCGGLTEPAKDVLAGIFRRHGLPVVLVNVIAVPPGRTEQKRFSGAFPSDFAEFVPELSPRLADHVVSKQTAGAFTKTDLEAWLRTNGVTQVVIVGVATSMGVESTARQGHELGFNVTLAVDAMTDMDPVLHDITIAKIFPPPGRDREHGRPDRPSRTEVSMTIAGIPFSRIGGSTWVYLKRTTMTGWTSPYRAFSC